MPQLLYHRVFVEKESHVGHYEAVGVGQQFIWRMISELTWPEGVEATDTAEYSTLFGQFFVDEGG